MQICTTGATRIVLLFSDFVIKIPKIPLIRTFKKKKLIWLLMGFISNRLEYTYSKKHPDSKKIIPVKGILFGLVLIQAKKEILSSKSQCWKKIVLAMQKAGIKDAEEIEPNNFCLDQNNPCLIDYGDPKAQVVLDCFGDQIIKEFSN